MGHSGKRRTVDGDSIASRVGTQGARRYGPVYSLRQTNDDSNFECKHLDACRNWQAHMTRSVRDLERQEAKHERDNQRHSTESDSDRTIGGLDRSEEKHEPTGQITSVPAQHRAEWCLLFLLVLALHIAVTALVLLEDVTNPGSTVIHRIVHAVKTFVNL